MPLLLSEPPAADTNCRPSSSLRKVLRILGGRVRLCAPPPAQRSMASVPVAEPAEAPHSVGQELGKRLVSQLRKSGQPTSP